MRKWLAILAGCTVLASGSLYAAPPEKPATLPIEDREIRALTSPELVQFKGEAEFKSWLRRLEKINDRKGYAWVRQNSAQYAQAEQAEDPCIDPKNCPAMEDASGEIVTTASKTSSNPSITNNQTKGVEEGDIVKQIGQFLIVLQDGRLFTVDTKAGNGRQLALADRANVYRNASDYMWYDEMLVYGNRITVTGYSYQEDASEISVFNIDKAGKISREGTFYISSDDYYDSDNYATRLVGDKLVIYTPVNLSYVDTDEPFPWPVVRRWLPEAERKAAKDKGKPLFDARQIYRPVQATVEPVIHTVSVCTIGESLAARNLPCRSKAFIGPSERQFYATTTDAYLWISPGWSEIYTDTDSPECAPGFRATNHDTLPSALYRIPLSGGEPAVVGTYGRPIDQFSLESSKGRFRALVRWEPLRCDANRNRDTALTFFSTPLSAFSSRFEPAPGVAFTPMPGVNADRLENRFTDSFLVYGGRNGWGSRPPSEDDQDAGRSAVVVAVPVRAPAKASLLSVPHNVIRAERAGDNIVLTGYRDDKGLSISQVDLRSAPRVASTITLERRFESEGRSHAFNSMIEADGRGLMGLPTVESRDESGRYVWRSDSSDVSFLVTDAEGRLRSIGALELGEGDNAREDKDYECEVSCIDWYGNSRPIFTDGRVFGLSGTSLIEGQYVKGKIEELQRVNLTVGFNDPKAKAPPPPTPPMAAEPEPIEDWYYEPSR